jgi:hypothetical protein
MGISDFCSLFLILLSSFQNFSWLFWYNLFSFFARFLTSFFFFSNFFFLNSFYFWLRICLISSVLVRLNCWCSRFIKFFNSLNSSSHQVLLFINLFAFVLLQIIVFKLNIRVLFSSLSILLIKFFTLSLYAPISSVRFSLFRFLVTTALYSSCSLPIYSPIFFLFYLIFTSYIIRHF